MLLPKVAKFLTDAWYGGGAGQGGGSHELALRLTNVLKILPLCGTICSLVFNKHFSNLATLLVLRRSYQLVALIS